MAREHVSGDEPTVSSRKQRQLLHDSSSHGELDEASYAYNDAVFYLPEEELSLEAFANIARSKRKSRALARTIFFAQMDYIIGKNESIRIEYRQSIGREITDDQLEIATNALIIDLYDYLNRSAEEPNPADNGV